MHTQQRSPARQILDSQSWLHLRLWTAKRRQMLPDFVGEFFVRSFTQPVLLQLLTPEHLRAILDHQERRKLLDVVPGCRGPDTR